MGGNKFSRNLDSNIINFMGLKKARTAAGFTAEYWNIFTFSWNKDTNKLTVVLNNYKDKATRDAGLDNKFDGSIVTEFDADETNIDEFIRYLYTKVKTSNTSEDTFVDTGNTDQYNSSIYERVTFFNDAIEE